MILKKYKPKGVLITIQKDAIQLWDLERDYDQVNNSCKRVCQLVFSQIDDVSLILSPFASDELLCGCDCSKDASNNSRYCESRVGFNFR